MMPMATPTWATRRRLRHLQVIRNVPLLLPTAMVLFVIFSIFALSRFPLLSEDDILDILGPKELKHPGDISPEIFHSPEIFKMNYEEMERQFKVFVYPDGKPDTYYHTPWKLTGKYASEGYFFKNIRESRFLTTNPNKAHMFFIPISCQKMRAKGLSYEKMTNTVQQYVQMLISKYPYWNRTLGADHFFVTCHDIGLKATNGIPDLVNNSIRVVCSTRYKDGYIPHKDLALPQVLLPFAFPTAEADMKNRTTLGFWAGSRNSVIRNELVNAWKDDDQLSIQKGTSRANLRYTSKFCVCPDGSPVNGARVTDSLHYGCVPVIMSENLDLPYIDILDWRKFSVTVKKDDVYRLRQILEGIKDTEFIARQKNTLKVQRHFEWNSPPIKYDAFHMVMYELWLRHHVHTH